ncbi:MAG: endolytic transglycosylase MltG [Desulfosarcinaceae bacterium]
MVTIPEGYTFKQIASELARLGLADEQAFIDLASDPATVHDFGLEGETMEGYLFPDTYYFPKGLPAKSIMAKMVERFRQQVPREWSQRARQLGLSLYQVITLASIIEKETGDASERPLISSVFHNRLKKHMRLESDPTVIYGIKNFDGNLTRKHLTTRTPYNTYTIRGLPKGPIANPGRDAIRAALYPAQTDFLFFVSKKDSTHHFSKTIEEHNRAVRKYQLRRRPKRKT